MYINDNEISNDPRTVIERWQEDFTNLYNNFASSDPEYQRFTAHVKQSNMLKEQDMMDPLYVSNDVLNCNIGIGEVKAVAMKAKRGKSPGIDLLPNEIYKNDNAIEVLQKLFQLCFDSGKIPSMWRKAIISPIPKGEKLDKRIPLNYRGISLLCCSAKLYTSLLNSRMVSYFDSADTLEDEQNGFRKDRSCQDHVFVLDSIIRNRLNDNLSTFCAYVDLQKAFDCVNRDFLMYKLLNTGINGKIYFAVKNIYETTEARVRLNNQLESQWFTTLFGVRQGDSMSPTLFSVYLNDLTREIKGLNAGINVNGRDVSILLYADDIALVAASEENLQEMLHVLHNWSLKWCINVNKTKSKIVHFRQSRVDQSNFEFKCGTSVFDYVSSYKYLGVTMSETLKYDENVELLSQAAGRALGSVIAKYKMHKFMGYSTFTKLFESCVCPVMEYASGVWGYENSNKTNMIQNRAARIFLGVHKFAPTLALEGDMGWMSTRYKRWLHILRLWNRLIALNDERLTKHIFVNDFYLAMSNFENWCTNVWRIFKAVDEENLFYNREPCDINVISKKLMNIQEENWQRGLLMKPKLRFYRLFKTVLQVENYAKYNLTASQRSFMAQLRLGILPLHIETGRFRNTKIEDRLCTVCNLNVVENEMHFLFECPCYAKLRQQWLQNIRKSCNNFDNLDNSEKLSLIFEKFHRCTAKFIQTCFNTRKELLFQ